MNLQSPTQKLAGEVQTGTPAPVPDVQQTYETTGLRQALKAAQRELSAAQDQVKRLAVCNLRLRQELMWPTRMETQALHDAYHDELTHLPNRRLLLDRLSQALGQAARQHKRVVLLLLDLDGFKAVNDKFGHSAGDKVLQTVAERLVACIRSADTACRYGGDEFIVMLPEINGQEDCASVERKIRTQLAAPYFVDGVELTMSVSVGTAVFPIDANDHAELLKQADAAMYRAKTNGDALIR